MRKHTLTYYKDRKGEWRWRLAAPNGNIVAVSGEGYTRPENAMKGFLSAQKGVRTPKVVTVRKPKK